MILRIDGPHPALEELMGIAEKRGDAELGEELIRWMTAWVVNSSIETFEPPYSDKAKFDWEKLNEHNAAVTLGLQACTDGMFFKDSQAPWAFPGRKSNGRRFVLTFLRVKKARD